MVYLGRGSVQPEAGRESDQEVNLIKTLIIGEFGDQRCIIMKRVRNGSTKQK